MIPSVLLRMLGVLAFFGTIAVMVLGAVVMLAALATDRPRLFRGTAAGVGCWVVLYALALVLGPVITPARQLAAHQELSFCGLDCHLHVAVTDVQNDSGLAVTLSFRSDAKRAPEFPSHLRIRAVDANGLEHQSAEGPLTGRLDAGQSFSRRLHFDVPANAGPANLVVTWGDWEDYVIPGPENALVQRRRKVLLTLTQEHS
jgi:hypothetical protein